MRSFWAAGLVLAALAANRLSGQPAEPPTLRSNVRQVLVPVVVTDKSGHYITDLKAADFEVFEDGVAQQIVAFSANGEASAPQNAKQAGVLNNPSTGTSTRKVEPPRRTYLICVDTLHSAFSNFGRVRTALTKFFEQEQSADSQYALFALGRTPQVMVDSTRESSVVLAALQSKKLQGMILESEASGTASSARQFEELIGDYCSKCLSCGPSSAKFDLPGCPGARARAQTYLMQYGQRTAGLNQGFLIALDQLVKATASMPTSRTVILISDGFNRFPGAELYGILQGSSPGDRNFGMNPLDSQPQLDAVIKRAVRYDVKFYTIDSRGLYTAAALAGSSWDAENKGTSDNVDQQIMSMGWQNGGTLAELAHETGGLFFENNNDLLKGIKRAFADGRSYYVLAYTPKNETFDGKFRKIKVDVKGRKLQVNSKAGYWAARD